MKGYRTLVFNIASVIVMAAETAGVLDAIPAEYQSTVGLVIAAANIVLRLMTTGPVGAK